MQPYIQQTGGWRFIEQDFLNDAAHLNGVWYRFSHNDRMQTLFSIKEAISWTNCSKCILFTPIFETTKWKTLYIHTYACTSQQKTVVCRKICKQLQFWVDSTLCWHIKNTIKSQLNLYNQLKVLRKMYVRMKESQSTYVLPIALCLLQLILVRHVVWVLYIILYMYIVCDDIHCCLYVWKIPSPVGTLNDFHFFLLFSYFHSVMRNVFLFIFYKKITLAASVTLLTWLWPVLLLYVTENIIKAASGKLLKLYLIVLNISVCTYGCVCMCVCACSELWLLWKTCELYETHTFIHIHAYAYM